MVGHVEAMETEHLVKKMKKIAMKSDVRFVIPRGRPQMGCMTVQIVLDAEGMSVEQGSVVVLDRNVGQL